MSVIYCDNHILVLEKPAGMLTQNNNTLEIDLVSWGKDFLKKKYKKPGNVFLEVIHRLDRSVSGLVLCARTSKALSRLQEAMRNRQIGRVYTALVDPLPSKPEGTLENYLLHDSHLARVVSPSHPEAQLARLHYKTIRPGTLEVTLETGRYHQIRAQLSYLGCPIRGDKKYGSTQPWKPGQIALCHSKLSFLHPVTKEPMSFSTQL